MMNASAQACSEWKNAGIHLKISVNISTRDLMDQELPEKFARILSLSVQAADLSGNYAKAPSWMTGTRPSDADKLHAMGMELSIDDFEPVIHLWLI
jgi:EAL domain-containing protein (putative c-di-GMP-specific phosphodiesterase class I)